jgi:hypothetical protein
VRNNLATAKSLPTLLIFEDRVLPSATVGTDLKRCGQLDLNFGPVKSCVWAGPDSSVGLTHHTIRLQDSGPVTWYLL